MSCACATGPDGIATHVCETFDTIEGRKACSYCAAMAVSSDERSSAMKAVIEGEQLQMEIIKLLQPDHVTDEDLMKVRHSHEKHAT